MDRYQPIPFVSVPYQIDYKKIMKNTDSFLSANRETDGYKNTNIPPEHNIIEAQLYFRYQYLKLKYREQHRTDTDPDRYLQSLAKALLESAMQLILEKESLCSPTYLPISYFDNNNKQFAENIRMQREEYAKSNNQQFRFHSGYAQVSQDIVACITMCTMIMAIECAECKYDRTTIRGSDIIMAAKFLMILRD